MIPNRKGWYYIAVKIICIIKRITIKKSQGNFYCLNYLHCLRPKNKLESHNKVCDNKDFCNILIRSEETKILDFNQYQKFDKAPFVIYEDAKCLTEKIDGCKNNPENAPTTKVDEHIHSDFSVSTTISSFNTKENKNAVYRGKRLLEKVLWILKRALILMIINFNEKKKWSYS